MGLQFTREQKDIINYDYSEGDIISVDAKAGASKTTTVVEICRRQLREHPSRNVLYLVYNTKMREEADTKMEKNKLRNVTVKTIHGLAYGKVGFKYRHKLGFNLRKTDIKNYFKRFRRIDDFSWSDADLVITEITDFFNSSKIQVNSLSHYTQEYYNAMIDLNNKNVPMVHDCYLKLFSLSKVRDFDYDMVIVDEAQDSNDITLDIVLNQISRKRTIKVFVGDKFQQIYSFRGSKNVMESVPSTKIFPLTKSFRFGPNIAKLSTQIINSRVDGNEQVDDNIHRYGSKLSRGVYISRSNFGVLKQSMYMLEGGFNIHFLKGLSEYSQDIKDLCYLYLRSKDKIKGYIKHFASFEAYESFCAASSNMVGLTSCKLVKKETPYVILRNIDKLKQQQTKNIKKADLVITNVHASKGLEFKNVILDDDFHKISKLKSSLVNCTCPVLRAKLNEELNLIYVAITRAKYNLVLNEDLSDWYMDDYTHISNTGGGMEDLFE